MKWDSSICLVTVNATLGTWRVYLDQHCPVELPVLVDWSISAPSNIVVTSPQNVATAKEKLNLNLNLNLNLHNMWLMATILNNAILIHSPHLIGPRFQLIG